jgi:hypothetical protein
MQKSLWNTLLLADWVTDIGSGLTPNGRFILMVVSIGCATGVICTIVAFVSSTIMSIHNRRIEAELKRDMIERGMSAEEISQVIEAALPPEVAMRRSIASWANKKTAI